MPTPPRPAPPGGAPSLARPDAHATGSEALDALMALLDRPLLEAWRALRRARQEANAAWFDALDDDDDDALEAAMDRQIACLIVHEGLRLRLREQELTELPWSELRELLDLAPASAQREVLSALEDQLEAVDDEEAAARVEALLSEPRPRAWMPDMIEQLAARGLRALAARALREVREPFPFLRGAEALSPLLDDEARRAVGREAWRLTHEAARLDAFGDYGASCVSGLWLRAVALWPVGDAEALGWLRWLERRVAMAPPEALEGTQDYDDLRLLAARAWAYHGDARRATRWFDAMGDARGYGWGELAPLLPEEDARALLDAHIQEQLTAHARALDGGEVVDIHPPSALEVLGEAPMAWRLAARARVDAALQAHPEARARWLIALVAWLPEVEARALWRVQLEALIADAAAARAGDAAQEAALDARLEALIDTLEPGGAPLDALLGLLERWPRPGPFADLDVAWPAGDLARPLAVLLRRGDATPHSGWGQLVADMVEREPALRARLPEAWAASLAPARRPGPRRLWIEPSTVEGWLRGQAADVQRAGVAIYAQTLGGWSEQAQDEALARLQASAAEVEPSPPPSPRRAWRAWLEALLAAGDLKGLRGAFALFAPGDATSTQGMVWLTGRLLGEPDALAMWLGWLGGRARAQPTRVIEALADVLEQGQAGPEARRACVEALEAAARTALAGRAGPDTDRFYLWRGVVRWASDDTLRRLWERRFMGAVCDEVRYTEVALALRLGGVERLRVVLEATRRVAAMPRPGA